MHEEVRVVVVDDHEDSAATLAVSLEQQGYTVRTAASGDAALEQVAAFRPHCVLLDIKMPGLDGLDLTKQLRATYRDSIVLIAVTGADVLDERVSNTFELVDHHLIKPVHADKLRRVLPPLNAG